MRKAVLSICSLAFLVLVSSGAFAQSGDLFGILEKTEKAQKKGTPVSIQISPLEIYKTLLPNTKNRLEAKVKNPTSYYMNVTATAVGMRIDKKTRKATFVPISETKGNELARHIKIVPESFPPPPNSTKVLSIIVETTPDMVGTQYAGVTFGGAPEVLSPDKAAAAEARKPGKSMASVAISPAATIKLLCSVQGSTEFGYKWLGEKTIVSKGGTVSQVSVENTGNGILRMQLKASVFNKANGENVAVMRRAVTRTVRPGDSVQILTEPSNKKLPPGEYSTIYTLSEEADAFPPETREITFQVK